MYTEIQRSGEPWSNFHLFTLNKNVVAETIHVEIITASENIHYWTPAVVPTC